MILLKVRWTAHAVPRAEPALGDEGLDLVEQIFAIVAVDLHGDGLGPIQGEDTQDGLGVNHVAAGAQVHVVGVSADNLHELRAVGHQVQLNVYRPHVRSTSVSSSYLSGTGIISHV